MHDSQVPCWTTSLGLSDYTVFYYPKLLGMVIRVVKLQVSEKRHFEIESPHWIWASSMESGGGWQTPKCAYFIGFAMAGLPFSQNRLAEVVLWAKNKCTSDVKLPLGPKITVPWQYRYFLTTKTAFPDHVC